MVQNQDDKFSILEKTDAVGAADGRKKIWSAPALWLLDGRSAGSGKKGTSDSSFGTTNVS